MIPATLSASAITAFESCPAYYKALYGNHTQRIGNTDAADLGTAIHASLEDYVRLVYMEKTSVGNLPTLLKLYEDHFEKLFGHTEHDLHKDGVDLLTVWFLRNTFQDVEQVLSVERKNFFSISTPVGNIKVNYIFDRLDKVVTPLGTRPHYRVVDYKSQRVGFNPEYVRKMIQSRIYALAIQMEHPGEDIVIEVEMDLLRHNAVSAFFTREDNVKTWKKLNKIILDILNESSDDPTRKINPNCRYCPIAATCPALLDNKANGGFQILGTDLPLATRMLHHLDNQMKGIESLRDQVEKVLLDYAQKENILQWEEDEFNVKVSASERRAIDSERLSRIIGPTLTQQYGKIGVTALDTMIKKGELTQEQIIEAKALLQRRFGEPAIKIDRKTPFEGGLEA